MNEVYFDIPYSSFKKDFLDTYSDELTENLFLHLLPYIIAQPQELNLYKMLISFDIKDSILYGLSDDIKARFLSASAQHKKSIHIGDNDTKNSYKIYFAEYSAYEKYCRLNDDEGIAYGFTYKDLDTFMEKKYHLLLSIYFTVQNLIRLACHQSKLYSLDNAQILSDITDENDDKNKLLTKRWLKTAWDNHRENALFIFGFVQVLLDKNGLTDMFKIKKFLTTEEITQLNFQIKEKQNLPSLFENYMNYKENIKDILGYALFAQDKLGHIKSSNANTPLQFTSLSKLLINKYSLEPKTIDFSPIDIYEKNILIEKNCK